MLLFRTYILTVDVCWVVRYLLSAGLYFDLGF